MYRNLKILHMTDFSPHVSNVNFVTNMRLKNEIQIQTMRQAGLSATGSNCGLSCICGDKIAPVASACGGLGMPRYKREHKKGLKIGAGYYLRTSCSGVKGQ